MSEDRTKEVLATLICALRQADEDKTYGWLSQRARSLIGTALMSIDGPVAQLIAERDAAVAAYDLLYVAYKALRLKIKVNAEPSVK